MYVRYTEKKTLEGKIAYLISIHDSNSHWPLVLNIHNKLIQTFVYLEVYINQK